MKYMENTHAHRHTHNDCSRNWHYLWWKYCEKRKVFSLALKHDRVEGLVGVNSKARECECHESCICIVGFSAGRCQKKSIVYKKECRRVAVQRGKQDQNHLQHRNTYK